MTVVIVKGKRPKQGVEWGRNWPLLLFTIDFLVYLKGDFFGLWNKGQFQLYMFCHNRLQAGESQSAAEIALGDQRSTREGRQVDLAILQGVRRS